MGRSIGRPRIPITERDKLQIEKLAGLGLTLDKIAVVLGVSTSTLDRWLKRPDILVLYKKGCVLAELTIAEALFEKAKSGDLTAIIWWEKTRCGRSASAEEKQVGTTATPVQIFLPENGRDG